VKLRAAKYSIRGFFLLLLLWSQPAKADFLIELFAGTAHNLDSTIKIYQSGQPTLVHQADWCTCPLEQAPYYSVRVGWWDKGSGWEIEMLHHKITLRNVTTDIARFRATFGYNMFLLNRAWTVLGFNLRVGMGPIIAHPSNTIRGIAFEGMEGGILNGRYYFVGAGLQLAVGKRIPIWGKMTLNLEGKVTAAYANLPIANGIGTTPNYAFHGLAGLGYRF
jgi:hypothetical protein